MGDGGRAWVRRWAGSVLPWTAFAALLAWGWRICDLVHALPAYWDALELTTVVTWYAGAIQRGGSPWLYPLAFFPEGWHTATYAIGPAPFLLLLPLYALGGAAFAVNVTMLLTFAAAFGGMLVLARRFVGEPGATLAALLYTFWGFRWFRLIGHVNILVVSALMPWVIWALERGLSSRRSRLWFGAAGVICALAVASSLYFLWIGLLLVGLWMLGRVGSQGLSLRRGLAIAAGVLAVAVILNLPYLYVFDRDSRAAETAFFSLEEISWFDASLNSLFLPNVEHPLLKPLLAGAYSGLATEPNQANLGLLAGLAGLAGLVLAWNNKPWRPVIWLVPAGLLLALGITLQWNDQPLQWAALAPLDQLLWQAGHALKPALFGGTAPVKPFAESVPTPGLLLAIVVPLLERARVFARYAFVAALGLYLLAGLAVMAPKRQWLRYAMAGLLVLEVLPPPASGVPFPPPVHPAFTWLREQNLDGDGVVDLEAQQPYTLALRVRGETIWATLLHGKPAVGGASSVWPAHVVYLSQWLSGHPHAFQNPEFVPLLRAYQVREVLLHMTGGYDGYEAQILQEARQNPAVQLIQCFDPPAQTGAWPYPICVLEVQPAPAAPFDVLFRAGWSGPESWGRWAEGTESPVYWFATHQADFHLSLNAFPNCVPGRVQKIDLAVNGVPLAGHTWRDCSDWSAEITIPAQAVQVGENELAIKAAYAARPVDAGGRATADTRALSFGFSRLTVTGGDTP